jgi:hypothetical protein
MHDHGRTECELTNLDPVRPASLIGEVQLSSQLPDDSFKSLIVRVPMTMTHCRPLKAVSKHRIWLYSALSSQKPVRTPRYGYSDCYSFGWAYPLLKSKFAHKSCSVVLATQDLVFGQSFTDHMFLVEHVEGQGWGQPVIKPFGNIPMHPAAQALHYGVCCFEGMKGYLGKDGKARLFR